LLSRSQSAKWTKISLSGKGRAPDRHAAM